MNVLQAIDVHHVYPNGVKALKGVSLEIKKGEVFGLLGPNGAGKTTLTNIMIGLLRPTKGKILINGEDLLKNFEKIKRNIGYAPQNFVFYEHLTVLENAILFATAYGIKNHKDRIKELFDFFQLNEFKNQQAKNLSGGQKRRLNLVLGLLHSPKILFLDEPSAGMDPQNRHLLWKSIEELARNEEVTIVLTTHLMEVADRLANRLAIIDHGRILAIGTPREIKQKYGKGEVIEVQFHELISKEKFEKSIGRLKEIFPDSIIINHSFLIHTRDAFKTLQKAQEFILSQDLKHEIKGIQFRSDTLEDVFIRLTGSKLRE